MEANLYGFQSNSEINSESVQIGYGSNSHDRVGCERDFSVSVAQVGPKMGLSPIG